MSDPVPVIKTKGHVPFVFADLGYTNFAILINARTVGFLRLFFATIGSKLLREAFHIPVTLYLSESITNRA